MFSLKRAIELLTMCSLLIAGAVAAEINGETGYKLQPGDMLLVTRNKLEHLSRFMKATNLGLYFDPTTIP